MLRILPYQLAHTIFSYVLGMKRVIAKFVPKLLNCTKKPSQLCLGALNRRQSRNRLPQTVVSDEKTWVYGSDVKTKAQSSQVEESIPKEAR